ncbi:MAG: alpha-amylase family glycosyl hydrolase [Spirochaetales bacterium]
MNNEIATAPGDLPLEMVAKRHIVASRQFRHDGVIRPSLPIPGQPVEVVAYAGAMLAVRSATIYFRTYQPDAETSGSVEMHSAAVEYHPLAEYVRPWIAELPAVPAGSRVSYRIEGELSDGTRVPCQDGHGFWFNYDASHGNTTFGYLVPSSRALPNWLERSTTYQIFVDRFADGFGNQLNSDSLRDPIGGALRGITARLPYLQDLGIGCIWLSPIGPAPSYHRYDAIDYISVDPMAGSVDDLVDLTARAHSLGIRVILDFVPSHMSSDHLYFKDAVENEDSIYRDWFTFYEWPHSYRSFLEMAPAMPSIRTESPEARAYLIRSAAHWVHCGIDGLRLDHVIGQGSDFWAEFHDELRKVRPDFVSIGEATDTGDALRRFGTTISAILDFPLARALRSTIATSQWSITEFENFVEIYDEYMGNGPGRVQFLDNHDMDRFLYVAGQQSYRLAIAVLYILTQSQPPVIYYGSEIGMTHTRSISDEAGDGDALARQPMIWDHEKWDHGLKEFFTRLIRLRSSSPALYSGHRSTLGIDADAGLFTYKKSCQEGNENRSSGSEEFVVAINLGEAPQTLSVEGVYTLRLRTPGAATADTPETQRGTSFTLPGGSGLLLQRE